MKSKLKPRQKIHLRIRKSIIGTKDRPRLSIFRSNKKIYCQLIDDKSGHTLAFSDSSSAASEGTNKTAIAKEVGKDIASKAKDINVETIVFDRSGYLYHGRVRALAEGAREGGLKF